MRFKTFQGKPCKTCGSTERMIKSGRCAKCQRDYANSFSPERKEQRRVAQHRAASLAWGKAHAEKKRRMEAYRRACNPGMSKAATAAYRKANPLKAKEAIRRWRRANPGAMLARGHNYRAARRGNGGKHTHKEWATILASYHGRCVYCGAPATERDHIVPVTRKGRNDIENIVPSCRSCNSSKQNDQLLVWLTKRSSRPELTHAK